MIVTGINATIYTFEGVPYILYSAYQSLYQENAQLRKSIGEKDILLVQMGEQLRESASERWHMRLEKVSVKKCSTPQKKLLAALREHGSNTPVRVDTLAMAAGMSRSTALRNLGEMEDKNYLTRRYGENSDLFIKINPDIERTPFHIEKITPVRQENRGGLREKKSDGENCENCGSPRIEGHKHLSYKCPDCGHFGEEWMEIPDMPTMRLPAVQLPARPAPVQVSLPVTPVPVTDFAKSSENITRFITAAPAGPTMGKHPRGIACPDCGSSNHWYLVPADWGGTVPFCGICMPPD